MLDENGKRALRNRTVTDKKNLLAKFHDIYCSLKRMSLTALPMQNGQVPAYRMIISAETTLVQSAVFIAFRCLDKTACLHDFAGHHVLLLAFVPGLFGVERNAESRRKHCGREVFAKIFRALFGHSITVMLSDVTVHMIFWNRQANTGADKTIGFIGRGFCEHAEGNLSGLEFGHAVIFRNDLAARWIDGETRTRFCFSMPASRSAIRSSSAFHGAGRRPCEKAFLGHEVVAIDHQSILLDRTFRAGVKARIISFCVARQMGLTKNQYQKKIKRPMCFLHAHRPFRACESFRTFHALIAACVATSSTPPAFCFTAGYLFRTVFSHPAEIRQPARTTIQVCGEISILISDFRRFIHKGWGDHRVLYPTRWPDLALA